mmetsp:Transcript_134985/g.234710  ORF Transcript_134985/g.234710 Transcript_134985/m.234710 type:complete len:206 (+) Transcript_134985:688-1305(+)
MSLLPICCSIEVGGGAALANKTEFDAPVPTTTPPAAKGPEVRRRGDRLLGGRDLPKGVLPAASAARPSGILPRSPLGMCPALREGGCTRCGGAVGAAAGATNAEPAGAVEDGWQNCRNPEAQGGGVPLEIRAVLLEDVLPPAVPPAVLGSGSSDKFGLLRGGRTPSRGGVVDLSSCTALEGDMDRPTGSGEEGRVARMPPTEGLA